MEQQLLSTIKRLDIQCEHLYRQGKERAGERIERQADYLREQLYKLNPKFRRTV